MNDDKRFFDTNILVYAFDRSESPKMRHARALIGETAQHHLPVISYQVWQEFAAAAIRKFRVRADAIDVMEAFEGFTGSMQMVHSSESMFASSIRLWNRYSLSWYDALIVAAALESDCGILYTEDMQDGLEIDGMRIVNPFL